MTERGGSAEAARRWLRAGHRTWRWNDGTYAGKNRYDGVETTDEGLLWFGFDGAGAGVTYRLVQPYEEFVASGPPVAAPASVSAELQSWIVSRRSA